MRLIGSFHTMTSHGRSGSPDPHRCDVADRCRLGAPPRGAHRGSSPAPRPGPVPSRRLRRHRRAGSACRKPPCHRRRSDVTATPRAGVGETVEPQRGRDTRMAPSDVDPDQQAGHPDEVLGVADLPLDDHGLQQEPSRLLDAPGASDLHSSHSKNSSTAAVTEHVSAWIRGMSDEADGRPAWPPCRRRGGRPRWWRCRPPRPRPGRPGRPGSATRPRRPTTGCPDPAVGGPQAQLHGHGQEAMPSMKWAMTT